MTNLTTRLESPGLFSFTPFTTIRLERPCLLLALVSLVVCSSTTLGWTSCDSVAHCLLGAGGGSAGRQTLVVADAIGLLAGKTCYLQPKKVAAGA